MERGRIRLGRIAGVRVSVDWSVLVIGAVIAFDIVTVALAGVAHGPGAWIAGVVGAAIFFASILAHELSHATVARRAGLRVDDITLWIFGGVAFLRDEPADARTELRIAAAGPLASLTIASLLLLLGLASAAVHLSDTVTALAFWLAFTNAFLAVFNLLPGAPLDGGRILAAVMWMRHGSRSRAQMAAARSGEVIGALMIALGVVNALSGGGTGSIWLAFIGLFIRRAARFERTRAQASELGARDTFATVADVMTTDPPLVSEMSTVDDARRSGVFASRPIALLLDSAGGVSGLVTSDAVEAVPFTQRATTTLAEVGIPRSRILAAAPADRFVDAVDRAAGTPFVVLENNRVLGVVDPRVLMVRG